MPGPNRAWCVHVPCRAACDVAVIEKLQALVFSFQHDRFGRVTQFHFDGQSLMMRQSRLLDFRSDKPTTEAYHMIRWMANRPIGDTRLAARTEEKEISAVWGDRDADCGKLPIDVQGV